MSLPALATVNDLAVWLGQTIAAGDARAQAVLTAASGQVRTAAGLNWVDANGNLLANIPEDAITITKVAAARAWLNPAGAKALTKGPFMTDWGDPGVMLTDDERATLAGLSRADRGIPGLGTIRMVAPRAASASRWLDRPMLSDPADDFDDGDQISESDGEPWEDWEGGS